MRKLQVSKAPMTGQDVLEDVPFSLIFNTVELGDCAEQVQDKIKNLMRCSKERLALHLALMPLVWENGLDEGGEKTQEAQALALEAYKAASPPDMAARMEFVD